LSKGADALYTIVAGGNQACNPHEVGHGAILPNSLIVADIFPRLRSTGYFGDMTRTFLKGEPTSAQSSLVETVIKAQKLALSKVKDGVDGSVIHNAVDDFFAKNGYFTEFKKGAWGGFFHSTGHGVGLDIHEKVSISPRKCILKTGNVITVEPGLYYRGIGGCRIEDTVAVEKNGMRKLSKYHYNWVIK
ncbi:MAG: aminopeptidase P family protein, partial [Opitutales bacterium]|nr:aminopeptidase P family protein [Opitutales bacterium]